MKRRQNAKKREDAIRLAKTKFEAHQMEIAPSEAEADRKQKERIAKAEQAIKEYNDGLAKRLAKRVKTRPGELQQSQAGCKTRLPLGQALNMDS